MGAPDRESTTSKPTAKVGSEKSTIEFPSEEKQFQRLLAFLQDLPDRTSEGIESLQQRYPEAGLPAWAICTLALALVFLLWVSLGALLAGASSFFTSPSTGLESPFSSSSPVHTIPSTVYKNSAVGSTRAECYSGTRHATLERILSVANTPVSTPRPQALIWINGPPGVGKSAVAHTLADRWRRDGRLGAFISFSRSNTRPDEQRYVIGTIAYQLAHAFGDSTLSSAVENAVQENPSIFSQPFQTQIDQLVVKPLQGRYLSRAAKIPPKFVVLDGIDELEDKGFQTELLSAFASVLKDKPSPIKLIVASRPEPHILEPVSASIAYFGAIERIDLRSDGEAQSDIEVFLRNELAWLGEQTDNVIALISSYSHRHFIFPSLIVDHVKATGSSDLIKHLLHLGKNNGLSAESSLDILYKFLLSSMAPPTREVAMNIMSHWIASRPAPLDHGMSDKSPDDHSTLDKFLSLNVTRITQESKSLRPLINIDVKTDASPQSGPDTHPFTIQPVQRSLLDFIADPARSGDLYLSQGRANANVALSAVRNIDIATPGPKDFFLSTATLCHYLANAELNTETSVELRQLNRKHSRHIPRQMKSCIARYLHKPSFEKSIFTKLRMVTYDMLLWITDVKFTSLPRIVFAPFERMLFL